jgi:hypothetical protein
MRTLNPGEVKPKGIDCSHYDREICIVRRHVYVPRMKPLLLPALFAAHHLGDRGSRSVRSSGRLAGCLIDKSCALPIRTNSLQTSGLR